MKKYTRLAFIYLILAAASGVFYREFTKYNSFTGKTTLAISHVHLFSLGAILSLIIAIFCMLTNLEDQKWEKRFYILYNISLPFMVIMFYVRGITQVLSVELSKGTSAAISGVAGISHILLGVSLFILFKLLKDIKVVHVRS